MNAYSMISGVGFQGSRIQINPGPWLEAMLIGSSGARADRLEFLNQKIDQAVDGLIGRGLGCIWAPFYTGFAGLTAETALQGVGTQGWDNLLELMGMWADRFADRPPSLLMPQTFNEPPAPDRYPGDWNNVLQPIMYQMLREKMPNHTILLTADGWSGMERMCGLNLVDPMVGGVPNPLYNLYDANTIWDFHPFRPSPFAQQGYIYTQYRHLGPINDPLRYPPDPRQRAKVEDDYLARATAWHAVEIAAGRITEGQAIAERAGVMSDLGYYFDLPQDGHWMRTQMFAGVKAWLVAQNLPPARLLAGEWGIVRTNGGFPLTDPIIPPSQGPDPASAVAYLGDFKSALDLLHCRTGPIHLDTLDYGTTLGKDHFLGRFDPDKIAAIAPHRRLIQWSVG